MANTYNQQFNPAQLSQNQQDLLMAALQSNVAASSNANALSNRNSLDFGTSLDAQMGLDTSPNGMYTDFEFDPQFMDFLGSNGQPIDTNFNEDEGSPEGDVDPSTLEYDGDHGEKRKSMSEDRQDDESGSKRREGEEKQSKKPGRKPLTSEPTTKRKAQNRAAQRAFRERKEKHLKDLETKVEELEKSSESANHENGLLRAQVERLQMELREFRRKLSMQSALVGRSPPNPSLGSFSSPGTTSAINAFNFEMPRFGSQSGSSFDSALIFTNNPSQTSPLSATLDLSSSIDFLSRHGSTDGSSSNNLVNTPASSDMRSQHGSISRDSPQAGMGSPGYGDNSMFAKMRNPSRGSVAESPKSYNIFTSPTTVEPTNTDQLTSESQNPQSRVFQFNAASSTSPSASSSSHYSGTGASSSCGTSPEPSTGVSKESTLDKIDESTQRKQFVDSLSSACGNKANPEPAAQTSPIVTTANLNMASDGITSNPYPVFGSDFDMFSASLPDFSEGTSSIQSESSFTGGLFNDSPALFDLSSPMNWNDLTGSIRTGLTPAIQKPNPFEFTAGSLSHIKEEEVVPGDGQMLSCNKIWDAIQQRPEFKDGNIDIDNLCTELRKKAKCSETGVVIDKHDVDAAMQRLPSSKSS